MSGRRIAVAAAAGVAVSWIVLADNVGRANTPGIVLGVAAGWSFVVSGLVAWQRQPDNPIGGVMVATGFARFATELMWSRQPVLATAGHVLGLAYIAGVPSFSLLFRPGGSARP